MTRGGPQVPGPPVGVLPGLRLIKRAGPGIAERDEASTDGSQTPLSTPCDLAIVLFVAATGTNGAEGIYARLSWKVLEKLTGIGT